MDWTLSFHTLNIKVLVYGLGEYLPRQPITNRILVYSKEEALARYRQANFVDCRINAYPDYTEYKGINRQPPNFIFAELDRSTFKTDRALKLAYNKTVENSLICWVQVLR